MVLRLSRRRDCLLTAVLLTVLFCLPYLAKDFLALEHDTLFHLSRIQGYGEALGRLDILPAVYPYKNNGFGYGSPMFYCDLLLLPFSLAYLLGVPVSVCYTAAVFSAGLFSAYALLRLLSRFQIRYLSGLFLTAAFVFSNYRITDFYVRGAFGEGMAMGFLIVILIGLFDLLEAEKCERWHILFFGLAGLICTHNLSFLLGALMTLLFVIGYSRRLTKPVFTAGLKAVLCAFLSTLWYTIPMMEQLGAQELIVHYYAAGSQLEQYSLPLWKYFANTTVFGYGNNDYAKDLQMTVNIGIALSLCGLLFPLVLRKKPKPDHMHFALVSWFIGLAAFLLPIDLVPWQKLAALRVLQFPWRLMTIALILFPICGALLLETLLDVLVSKLSAARAKQVAAAVSALLSAAVLTEGIWHLLPCFERTFGITSKTTWNDITSGAVVDPYYSASYMRVELAGGDYLPWPSPDFRQLAPAVYDSSGTPISTAYEKNGTRLSVPASSLAGIGQDRIVELPLTWYKGYTAYSDGTKLPAEKSDRGLVIVHTVPDQDLTVVYQGTPLRTFCIFCSLLFWIGYGAFRIRRKDRHKTAE